MKTAITGLANSGKTTIFNALTGLGADTAAYAGSSAKPNIGVVKVPDERVDKLSEIFKPKKIAYATVEFVDFAGLKPGDAKHNKAVFDHIKDADALLHVVRAFEDGSVPHPVGSVDARRDVKAVESEIVFIDFDLVEKRLDSMEKLQKKGQAHFDMEEKKALDKCRAVLEQEEPLSTVDFTQTELQAIRHLQFLTMKPEVVVVNASEEQVSGGGAREGMLEGLFAGQTPPPVLTVCAKVEMELSEFEPEEAEMFLLDLGEKEPATNRVIRATYGALGLISFFTVGSDEVKAWTVRKGQNALEAAGKIHSDIQRGFIRAEVVGYWEFISSGGLLEAREKGLLRQEGKTYLLKDGDIINFKFNV